MSQFSPLRQTSAASRRMLRRLRRRHIVVLTSVAAAAVGLAGLRAVDLPGPRPVMDGERLRIEVVHPIEPAIVPGSRMDVGELVTGFNGLPPAPPALTDAMWSYNEGAVEDLPPPPSSSSWERPAVRALYQPPEPEPPRVRRAESRWFGFDAPRRDYQAERAARRARLEAMDREAWERREARRRDWEDRRADERRRDWEDRRADERRREDWRAERWRDAAEPDGRAGDVDGEAFTASQ